MKTKKIASLSVLGMIALMFQNCEGIDQSNMPTKSGRAAVESMKITNATMPQVLSSSRIDLLDYMDSSNIQDGQSNLVYFRKEIQSTDLTVFSVVKFNDSKNVEVFQADEDYIYIRYEASPESYGGFKNVVRRMNSVRANTPSVSMESAFAQHDLGAIWSKRFINSSDLGVPMVTAHSIDAFNFAEGGQEPQRINGATTPYNEMFIWHDIEEVRTSVPFVNSSDQPDHKLVISQQWSECNVEQYEYARGIGYVGWRSLVSTHSSCSHKIRGNSNSTKSFKNYYRNGQTEVYKVVQGMDVESPIDLSSFPTVAEPSFYSSGIFLDDYPYIHSTPNNYLTELRNRGVRGDKSPEEILRDEYTRDVLNAYQEVLKRGADSAGLEFYVSKMMEGLTKQQVIDSLKNSNEYRELVAQEEEESRRQKRVSGPDYESIVKGLYLEILEREGDSGGVAHYVSLMERGVTEDKIRSAFLGSQEYKRLQESKNQQQERTSADIVTEAYRSILYREPDSAGLGYYAGLMDNHGKTEADIKGYLSNSREGKVHALYMEYLGRPADQGGLNFYLGLMRDHGFTIQQVEADIVKNTQ